MGNRKIAFFLPNIFTALNMACGFAAVILSWKGDHYLSCMVIILGSIFDSVDGRVARMTGTSSQFGEEFDSISDVISFGMAPSIIFYNNFLSQFGRLGLVLSFLYLLCGALRLARFNSNHDKVHPNFFQGLPIPCAALGIIGYVFISLEYPILKEHSWISMVYIVLYSILMISNIPFCSFKDSDWVRNHKKQVFAVILLILCMLFALTELMIGIFISSYVIGSVIYFFTHKGAMESIFEWNNEYEES